jgi:hypothetical protein
MGFSTLIDILGATIIGGLLLLILFRVNDTATQNTFVYTGELMVQQALVQTVSIIEHDFRKMGYCEVWENIPDPTNAIINADSNRISFLTDVPVKRGEPGDGVIDTLHYYIGPTSELAKTDNPNDRLLYRVINSETPKSSNVGITDFKLTYFDSFNEIIPTPISGAATGSINTIQIDLEIQTIYGYKQLYNDQLYNSVFWRQIRLAAKNLRNR